MIERVQNKIIRISKAYILYKLTLEQKMKVLSENDIETVQTHQRFINSENFYRFDN